MHDHIWQGIGSTIALRKNSSTYWEMSRETLEEGLKLLRLNTPASQAGLASLDDQIQACMHDFVDLYIYMHSENGSNMHVLSPVDQEKLARIQRMQATVNEVERASQASSPGAALPGSMHE